MLRALFLLAASFAALLLVACDSNQLLGLEDGAVPENEVLPSLELTGRVVDDASILNASFESALTTQLAQLEENTGVQLVVVTTRHLNGEDIADYSLNLANSWGIGSAERNDGLMLLIAPNERQVRIEVGYGLEGSVKDEEAAQIIAQDIVPAFARGDFETGIQKAVDSLVREVTPYELGEAA